MKRLFLIGGTMGVGKTATSQELKKILPHAVFLDGDWCWDADPFIVTEETKAMVQENIAYLLNNFLHCSAYENIIFCWVMHQQAILDALLASLDTRECEVFPISLICSAETLTQRIQGDIAVGRRTPDVLERALPRLSLYDELHTIKVATDNFTPLETAKYLAELHGKQYF